MRFRGVTALLFTIAAVCAPPAAAWDTPVAITPASGGTSAQNPQVAMDGQGRAVGIVVAGLLAVPASSPATSLCSVKGPAWTVYPAHSNAVYKGTVYRVVASRMGCARAKGYVRHLFVMNPRWPSAGSGSTTLKGAPAGWRCRSAAGSGRDRKTHAGDCLSGSGPSDVKQFSWAPKMPAI